MIFVKSPLRITFGGGGTDLPSYYEKNTGFLISATIDKYIYITVYEPFKDYIFLKYSTSEKVTKIKNIKHPIIRKVLDKFYKNTKKIEIQISADVPAGTGVGSSGAFTVALIKALHAYNNQSIGHNDLAEKSCSIEINELKRNVGKQDQYSSVFGGINSYEFKKNKVKVKPLKISKKTINNLEDNLCLFFTKFSRNADKILKKQNTETINKNKKIISNLNFNKELAYKSKYFLENGQLENFADILNDQWNCKIERSPETINNRIKNLYNLGLKNGALGGKLVGAGGGGFLLFYTNDKEKLTYTMEKEGIGEMRFKFDFNGVTRII